MLWVGQGSYGQRGPDNQRHLQLDTKGINVTLEHDCDASAVILILSAIDAMAYLTMPKDQRDVRPDDFIKWPDQCTQANGLQVGQTKV